MKRLSGYIAILLFLLVADGVCHAQKMEGDSIDLELDKYELLCDMCMSLKARIRQGENVSKAEAQTLINRFLNMNKTLKERENEMSAFQKMKFLIISQWFSTGKRPSYAEVSMFEPLPQVGHVDCPDVPLHTEGTCGPVLDHRSEKPALGKPYLMASVSFPDISYGLWAGYSHGRFGGYASFRSNYVFAKTSYECTSDGSMPQGGVFWANGHERTSNLMCSAGGLVRLNRSFSAYAGVGYGWRKLAWQDIDGAWAEVSDWTLDGAAFETGLLLSWDRFTFSAGVSTISFKSVSMTLGAGINF